MWLAYDKHDRREILTRDIVTISSLVAGAKALLKSITRIFEKKNKFYLVPEKELTYLNGVLLDGAKMISENDVITIGVTELTLIPFCKEGRLWT